MFKLNIQNDLEAYKVFFFLHVTYLSVFAPYLLNQQLDLSDQKAY